MRERPWDTFFREKMQRVFSEKKSVVDIGGGLRVDASRNNRYDPSREWLKPLIANVDYKILDKVPDYNPDIVGDIHALPFENNSQDALICIAVLEHVEEPHKAIAEMYRVLKPGGFCFIYVPFLFYYHAEKGYYGDFWRFTNDSLTFLTRDFSSCEIVGVRGAIETLIRLSPLGRSQFLCTIGFWLDSLTGKLKSNQVSGYNVFLVK
jgi:SAM-dependent methyltransferase